MRLIDADALVHDLIHNRGFCPVCVRRAIEAAPTIEAKPVVHGEWVEVDVADYKCSVCGFRFTSADPIAMFHYCRCGADMRERIET